jgi:hypothetical protein
MSNNLQNEVDSQLGDGREQVNSRQARLGSNHHLQFPSAASSHRANLLLFDIGNIITSQTDGGDHRRLD